MSTQEIIAQVIGIALIITTIATPQFKKRSQILFVILLANILSCLQFYFVSAEAGLYALIITTIRSVVYWAYSKNDKQAPLFIFIAFSIAQIIATITGWTDWFSLLTLCLLLITYGQWQTKEKALRICLLLSALLLGAYCIHTHAYTGALNKFLQAASTGVALYRTRPVKHK
jgi:hypothetical protein